MRKLITFLLLTIALPVFSQNLAFRSSKEFKIAQFADTHIISGKQESVKTISLMEMVLDKEKPDLVIFSGDVVTGKPAREGWEMVLAPVVKRNLPFAVVLGNHDFEQDLSLQEIADLVRKTPGNQNILSQNGEIGDSVLEIKSSKGNDIQALVYLMDSHTYSKDPLIDGYGWFNFDQVAWFRERSDYYFKSQNKVLPALAYFHIPLPEYREAYNQKDLKRFGERLEDECPSDVNTGMFLSMVEKRSVMGTFVGHDHNNDYIVAKYGIAIAYGRFSGSKNTYTDTQPGARIVTLLEGKREFKTHTILSDGTIINQAQFP